MSIQPDPNLTTLDQTAVDGDGRYVAVAPPAVVPVREVVVAEPSVSQRVATTSAGQFAFTPSSSVSPAWP